MDVNKLDRIEPTIGSKDKRKQRHPDELEEPRTGGFGPGREHERGHGHGEHEVEDRISIMGIPAEDMTPAVERAIKLLLEEIHDLRNQLIHSRGHEAYLERHADEHPFLPVMNRRALVGRLNQVVARARENKTMLAFIYLHVSNAESLRTRLGHDAEEALLRSVANGLRRVFGSDALIGSMDSADFGIILPVTNEDDARTRMKTMVVAVRSETAQVHDVSLSPDVVAGLHLFQGKETAEQILNAADADLIQQGKPRVD